MNFYFTTPWLALGNGAERLADLNLFFYLYNNLNINYDFYIDQFLNLEFFINCGALSSTLVTLGQPAGFKKRLILYYQARVIIIPLYFFTATYKIKKFQNLSRPQGGVI